MSTQTLEAIFEAERNLRRSERELLDSDHATLVDVLAEAVDEAKALSDRRESVLRLERLADLCAQVEGPEMVNALFKILDDEAPSVRIHAAEALVDVAFERYAEVARATEQAVAAALTLKDAGPALQELPWVILEVGEPSARSLICRFLKLADPVVVASAVEALAQLGDPDALPELRPLADDQREVETEVEEGEVDSHPLGALVCETIEFLESLN